MKRELERLKKYGVTQVTVQWMPRLQVYRLIGRRFVQHKMSRLARWTSTELFEVRHKNFAAAIAAMYLEAKNSRLNETTYPISQKETDRVRSKAVRSS